MKASEEIKERFKEITGEWLGWSTFRKTRQDAPVDKMNEALQLMREYPELDNYFYERMINEDLKGNLKAIHNTGFQLYDEI